MPRSGTSMTAYVFARQGYFAAEAPDEDLHPGDAFNPTGYWEPRPVIDANAELFRAVGYPHHNTWLFDPITAAQAEAIATVPVLDSHRELVRQYDAHPPWMWKDPRLCYTLGYWWPLMNPATTAVLLIRRDPEEIVRSFRRLGWRTSDDCRAEVLERVQNHLAAAERAIEALAIPHLAVDYADFHSRPAETAARISAFFHVRISAQDLGFRPVLNHSRGIGWISHRAMRVADHMPAGLRRLVKRLLPTAVMNRLFPGLKRNREVG